MSTLGLVVANTWISASNWYEPGTVSGQNPQAGAGAFVGDSLDMTVVPLKTGAPVTIPNVTGLRYAEADAVLGAENLSRACCISGNSATVPAGGIVISQSPAGGAEAAENSTVGLVVSAGPAPVVVNVPNVVGLTQTAAEAAITSAGLALGNVVTASSATVPAGDVISQTPAAGTEVGEGAAVDLVVSSGPALVTVPGVVGLTQTSAEAAITSAGLSVGTITSANSDTIPAGNVINQTPAGGTQVTEGSNVDIVVSSGPALIAVPNVVSLSYSTAVANITNAGLNVGTVSTVLTRRSCGVVSSQTPVGGTGVQAGSQVILVVTRTRFCNPL